MDAEDKPQPKRARITALPQQPPAPNGQPSAAAATAADAPVPSAAAASAPAPAPSASDPAPSADASGAGQPAAKPAAKPAAPDSGPGAFIADAHEAVNFRLVTCRQPDALAAEIEAGGKAFSVEFMHQHFGDSEHIRGYSGLRVTLWGRRARGKALHARLEPLLLFTIDGANFIDDEDPQWELLLPVARAEDGGCMVLGVTTLFNFYAYPASCRLRLSQVLVLGPWQGLGLGKALLRLSYGLATSRGCTDLTVEDPTPNLQRVREKLEVEMMRELGWVVRQAEKVTVEDKVARMGELQAERWQQLNSLAAVLGGPGPKRQQPQPRQPLQQQQQHVQQQQAGGGPAPGVLGGAAGGGAGKAVAAAAGGKRKATDVAAMMKALEGRL
ncbi:Histone acetyltransferase type B catalytic subunit [Tetrabaena socialis]|uniref:histone acetyltransferase n=1 Tax=Tetrabaena socialis TaxID=47790 RepID=A0A2J7ZN56_9CHLO|nr:Histone acetyltransferase type B catalytic subunit [Tetrabaena socialis]|eukprot:PNH01688.1 Histone acetyltransferase type B catalytic subunit [Tetrabaena socialis]